MSETPEAPDSPPVTPERDGTNDLARESSRSRWSTLNRTNRVAALILSAVAALILAVLIFGAGVFAGTELGGSEEHHHTSENADDGGDGSQRDGDTGQEADSQGGGRERRDGGGDRSEESTGSEPSEAPATGDTPTSSLSPSSTAPRP